MTSLDQCRPGADGLLDNFRIDNSCQALDRFAKKGVSREELVRLKERIPSAIYPWDPQYNDLRFNYNKRFVFFPLMIVMARSDMDIINTILFARQHEIHCVMRSGSHCFKNYSLTDGIILDQSMRTGIRLLDNDVVELESGCLLGPTQLALSKSGLAMVAGTCSNNGVAGLTLGGGIGFLLRRLGLGCDSLLGAEAVLADGSLVRCDIHENQDLWFALKGAGTNNFCCVTKLYVQAYRISSVTYFNIVYRFGDLMPLIDVWQRWCSTTDWNLTSEMDVYRDRIVLDGQFLGTREALIPLLQVFARFTPTSITMDEIPFIDAVRRFDHAVWAPFFCGTSGFAKKILPPEAIDIIERYMSQASGSQTHLELDAMGGINDLIPTSASAFPHRKGTLFWFFIQAHYDLQDEGYKVIPWVQAFYDEMLPYLSGGYVNGPNSMTREFALEAYYGVNLTRLRQIKAKYDPQNFFHYAQSIDV